MPPPLVIVVTSLVIVFVIMLVELRISLAHERELFRAGAIEAPDPVYATMRWAYPGTFVAMALEGLVTASPPGLLTVAGAAVFIAGKALKVWAIASLGTRWTYRVLVIPNAPLVARGPYRFLRHPNYVGVVGELVGMAMLVQAPVTGVLSVVGFGCLLRLRIRAEEQALGLHR
jgi:methyltransferase